MVQAQWRGGWWEARVVGRTAEGRLRLQSLPEPDGENEAWEAPPQQARPAALPYPRRTANLHFAPWAAASGSQRRAPRARAQVRAADPAAGSHFGMTAPVADDDMIPLERYRCCALMCVL